MVSHFSEWSVAEDFPMLRLLTLSWVCDPQPSLAAREKLMMSANSHVIGNSSKSSITSGMCSPLEVIH